MKDLDEVCIGCVSGAFGCDCICVTSGEGHVLYRNLENEYECEQLCKRNHPHNLLHWSCNSDWD